VFNSRCETTSGFAFSCKHRPRVAESRIDSLDSPMGNRAPARRSRVLHCRPCARARRGNRVAPSLESRTDQDSSARILPRRNECFKENRNTFRRDGFPPLHSDHSLRRKDRPRYAHAPFEATFASAHAFVTLRPLVEGDHAASILTDSTYTVEGSTDLQSKRAWRFD